MNKSTLAQQLRALASDSQRRTKAALLRDVIDDVELALAAGVSRSTVVETLNAQGLEMSMATFESTLKRIRAKRAPATPASPSPAAPSAVPPANAVSEHPPSEAVLPHGFHNPAALDHIISGKPNLTELAKIGRRKTKR